MKTTDWKFDFSSLPHRDSRNSLPFVYDEFYEIPQSDTLCCIYSIAEVRMCDELGFLAIIQTNDNPALYLNVDSFNFCNNVSVSANGNLIFLQPSIYYKEFDKIKRPILIIDVSKNAFSYIDTDNFNPCYEIVQINDKTFKIQADEFQRKYDKRLRKLTRKKIRVGRLKWRDLAEVESLPELIFEK